MFCIKPLEHSPQCITWIPSGDVLNEDAFLFGDDQGFVNLVTVTGKDLAVTGNQEDKNNMQNFIIDPNKLTV